MPYLHCPHCHRTAWLSATPRTPVECRRCGAALDPMGAHDARFLTNAVRDLQARRAASGRFARGAGKPSRRAPR
jgi:ribosomal protein S27E